MKNRIGLLALLLSVLAIAQFTVAGEGKTCRISFHTVNGMVLLDAEVNGKPAVLVLDTGSGKTIISAELAGIDGRRLQQLKFGLSPEGRYVKTEVELRLGKSFIRSGDVLAMNLSDAKKQPGLAQMDGILGQDILREFSSVRIDYKSQVVELEP